KCSEFYQTWIEKSLSGWADAVFVAEREGQAEGYIACHLEDKGAGTIGLAGVKTGCQGKGIGPNLMYSALGWFEENGCDRVSVVTQGRNTKALRYYQNCGFHISAVQLWYHKWFDTQS
ncbi:GNAT family N-acetyltransferase, partial [Acidobacteriota bacterium]